MESLKRKGDTQGTQKKDIEQRASSPLSSQLSALLFSSSPPEPKQVKVDNKLNDSFIVEDDLDELLKELDDIEEEDLFNGVTCSMDSVSKEINSNSVSCNSVSGNRMSHSIVDTLNYFTEKDENYSEVDSLYKSKIDQKLFPPMIDISTPQIFTQKPAWEISDLEESQKIYDNNKNNKKDAQFKVLLPETFDIEDLKDKIRIINQNLHLNPIEAIKQSNERRISFQLALMLRDFRQMGSMAQLRLLDGNGNEIVGTLALSACTELEFKLHFGLILILSNVSVFSPVPGQKYLNITKQNIQSFHYNITLIT